MSDTAVLVVDMLNTYEHEDAEELVPNVAKIIEPLADLVGRARESDSTSTWCTSTTTTAISPPIFRYRRSAINGARPDLVEPIVPDGGCRC